MDSVINQIIQSLLPAAVLFVEAVILTAMIGALVLAIALTMRFVAFVLLKTLGY